MNQLYRLTNFISKLWMVASVFCWKFMLYLVNCFIISSREGSFFISIASNGGVYCCSCYMYRLIRWSNNMRLTKQIRLLLLFWVSLSLTKMISPTRIAFIEGKVLIVLLLLVIKRFGIKGVIRVCHYHRYL